MTRYLGVATDDMTSDKLRGQLQDNSIQGSGAGRIGYDGETVESALDKAKAFPSYTELRAYKGLAEVIHITNPGIEGFFQEVATASPVDNGYSLIVDSAGRAWSRIESYDKSAIKRNRTLADFLRKAHTGSAVTIACEGDSLTYGQDTSPTGVDTQINGASQKRSTAPYPEKLAESLSFAGFAGGVTVVNRGFPGDNTAAGLTRWATAGAVDLVIIMYGTNDAQNYGGLGVIEIAQYRINLTAMIDRRLAQGAAVILLTPPAIDSAADLNIRPYADAMREVAKGYGLFCIDSQEQLSTLSYTWTDGVHLTSFAYRELGWHLAALMLRRDGGSTEVAPGSMIFASENMGFGGSRFTWINEVDTREMVSLAPGQTLAVGVYCGARVQPIIHSLNGTASETVIKAYNSAGLLGAVQLNHNPSNGVFQQLYAVPVQKGYRVIYVRNESATITAYIASIEFAGMNSPAVSYRNSRKINSLSGTHIPSRANLGISSGGWMSTFSYEMRAKPFGGAIFRVRLPSSPTSGVALVDTRVSNVFPQNGSIMAIREGVNLLLRQYLNSTTITTITVSGFFTSGVEWAGELELEMPSGSSAPASNIKLYANGVNVAMLTTPSVISGWPGLVCMGAVASTPICESAFIYGYDKELVK